MTIPTPNIFRYCLFAIGFMWGSVGYGQTGIDGIVHDQNNDPVPFVNIYIRNDADLGTSTDPAGHFSLELRPGLYEIIFSSVGYKILTLQVIVGKSGYLTKEIHLENKQEELEEFVIRASRRDPAYEIIQNAIDNRERFRSQILSSKTEIYLKATEVISAEKKKKKEKQVMPEDDENPFSEDPVAQAKKELDELVSHNNFLEMQVNLSFQSPDKFKEERTAYRSYGSKAGLFVPRLGVNDINFYYNLVYIRSVVEGPVVSPISRTAILTYKYKLEETLNSQDGIIYKIKVTPRKAGNSSMTGYIYITDSIWSINRVDLAMHKGGLKLYDDFRIRQDYQKISDSLWIPYRQEFNYTTHQGQSKTFEGSTVMVYSDFQNNYIFPPKFFGNEVGVTTQEAYDRDSNYWNINRPEPLTHEEHTVVRYRDSVKTVVESKYYKDSLEAKYNRVTFKDIAYNGISFSKWEKEKRYSFPSLLDFFDFSVIGGIRLHPRVFYSKRLNSAKRIYFSVGPNIGIKNADLQGSVTFGLLYSPMHRGWFSVDFSRNFSTVNDNDAYLNQIKISNYILTDNVRLSNEIELFNGFYVGTYFKFTNRNSVDRYDASSILNTVIKETDPLSLSNYQAFITGFDLHYTPRQQYMREPKEKIILGSIYPRFNIHYKKGWYGLFSSDVDFDYIDFSVDQKITLGIFGISTYSATIGKFLNTNVLKYEDLKRFRASDPLLFAPNAYQLLDTSLIATDYFFEVHNMHHFNGAIANYLPLIKKLRFTFVAGIGVLWVKESNYWHEELFAGIERVFKLGARRRLRIGAYGAVAESNHTPLMVGPKVSFDIIDTWKNQWSF